MKFNVVVCGGTFDQFHKGHESLLKLVFSLGEKIIVGITSDEYGRKFKIRAAGKASGDARQNSKFKIIEDFNRRKQSVLEFIEKENARDQVEIVSISDLFGPTLSKDSKIDAIVVSEETKKGADTINKKRQELGLDALKIFVAPSIKAEDGDLISSNRIRAGEINKAGKLYINPLWLEKDLLLTEDLRDELKKPFGEFVKELVLDNNIPFTISVGDATTKKFNENFINQDISVIDFKVAREEKFFSFSDLGFQGEEEIITVNNPAGHLTHDLFLAIKNLFKSYVKNKKIIIKIVGEDDLTVLPLILSAPLNTVIYYGQPPLRQGFAGQAGLIKIVVSEISKEKAYSLVSRFRPI
ncbi:MAG: pantetheine-phosphate adenylyltransferase [Candidatus Levybacteria bacterium]|nr:pantetheine-phosphate adenylyltransferase [Candidatus Levybacteria bacterium]